MYGYLTLLKVASCITYETQLRAGGSPEDYRDSRTSSAARHGVM